MSKTDSIPRHDYAGFKFAKPFKPKKIKANKKAMLWLEDARWSASVKIAAGLRCEYTGCTIRIKGLAAHHIFTRSIKATRHYLPNGACLCNGHHMFFAHKNPHAFKEMMIAHRGQAWWDDLNARARGLK